MDYIQAIILAIIEGITEFLPISSTGHIIIASPIMGIQANTLVKLFTVCIQFGAILSVVVLYFKKFFKSVNFYFKLIVAFIPAAICGLLFKKHIDALLENPLVVGISLFIGGIILLFVDGWFKDKSATTTSEEQISYKQSILIGCFQCIAMIPGVSRSAATIIGGMSNKLNRQTAAEFAFFVAVPTMFAATVKDLYDYIKVGNKFTFEEIKLFAVGNVVAFVVAMIAIKFFIAFLTKYGFKPFGYYRIIVGGIIILLYASGRSLQMF
jgi:undecaprenyl-diphosphatase